MAATAGKVGAAPAENAGGAPGAGGDKSLPDPTVEAKRALGGLLVLSALLALAFAHFGWATKAFKPAQTGTADFALFAGFYVAAQVIERLLEVVSPVLPLWSVPGTDEATKAAHAKADRAALLLGVATVAGVLASCAFGLYFLAAVGIGVETTAHGSVSTVPRWIDVLATGLIIGAGTKPLHDLITNIQNKDTPKTGTTVS